MVSLSSFLWTKAREDCRSATAWDKDQDNPAAAPADIEQIMLYPSIQRYAGSLIFAFAAIDGEIDTPAGASVSPRGRCRNPRTMDGPDALSPSFPSPENKIRCEEPIGSGIWIPGMDRALPRIDRRHSCG